MVSECSLETVDGLCTEMKIVEKCSPQEDCDMFSCKSVPDTRLEARNYNTDAKVDIRSKKEWEMSMVKDRIKF